MSLSSEEKGDLIFKEIRNSYTFWQIKKSLKDEMIKPSGKAAKQLCCQVGRRGYDLDLQLESMCRLRSQHVESCLCGGPLHHSVKRYKPYIRANVW